MARPSSGAASEGWGFLGEGGSDVGEGGRESGGGSAKHWKEQLTEAVVYVSPAIGVQGISGRAWRGGSRGIGFPGVRLGPVVQFQE